MSIPSFGIPDVTLPGMPSLPSAGLPSLPSVDVMEALAGFLRNGGLVAIPILAAFAVVGGIGGLLVWSAQPAVRDDEDD